MGQKGVNTFPRCLHGVVDGPFCPRPICLQTAELGLGPQHLEGEDQTASSSLLPWQVPLSVQSSGEGRVEGQGTVSGGWLLQPLEPQRLGCAVETEGCVKST